MPERLPAPPPDRRDPHGGRDPAASAPEDPRRHRPPDPFDDDTPPDDDLADLADDPDLGDDEWIDEAWADDAPLDDELQPDEGEASVAVDPLADDDDLPDDDPLDDLITAAEPPVPELEPDEPLVLPWRTTATVDGQVVPALLDPTRETTVWQGGRAGAVTVRLEAAGEALELTVEVGAAEGEPVLRIGRDLLAGRVLVRS